jgi:aminoglycoside phosphotransferase (APT) family kinase protein
MTALDIEDAEALCAYLRASRRIAACEMPRVTILRGGVSNRTVLVERESGESWVLKQALPALRVAVEWLSSPERALREAQGARWLGRLLPEGSVPTVLFEDAANHLFAMTAVPSSAANWKTLLLDGRIDRGVFAAAARLLAAIHREGSLRRDELEPVFCDTSFFESLRLEPYYEYTATRVCEASAFLQELAAGTRSVRLSLVHGDFSPKNILIDDGRLVLLDHEVIHFGDPGFDVGFSMAHFLSKAHHLRRLRTDFAQAAREYWREYSDALAQPDWIGGFEARCVRHTIGCLLARVGGRSPLEYLSDVEREHQQTAAIAQIQSPTESMGELIDRFLKGVDKCR